MKLTADEAVIKTRIANTSRVENGKLTDPALYRRLREAYVLKTPVNPSPPSPHRYRPTYSRRQRRPHCRAPFHPSQIAVNVHRLRLHGRRIKTGESRDNHENGRVFHS
ncbi:MAG: hypothetical protein H7343_02725 [Undibacterium sp.]|nr:hypothetical protein [Opitutaceae bacterium]